MPITRRRRANPPEQPENNNLPEQSENVSDQKASSAANEHLPEQENSSAAQTEAASGTSLPSAADNGGVPPFLSTPVSAPQNPVSPVNQPAHAAPITQYPSVTPLQQFTQPAMPNGDRGERPDYPVSHAQPMTPPTIETGRRTARGEVFRRPPQPPMAPPVAAQSTTPPLQAPSHEISLPLGNLLHLAYNPGYTGSDEARSALLQKLEQESQAGGRARCWSCGSLAIVYDRWNTRSKAFGEVGVAFCEICGVWSVM